MIKRQLSVLGLAVVLVFGAASARADSVPVIQGSVSGLELCPQSLCGAAIFVGVFKGQVGFNPHAVGSVIVAVNHEPLPDPDETSDITGGIWVLHLLSGRKITGLVTGGTLFNNGDNTFELAVNMLVVTGGFGDLLFKGTLSHVTFPPTISGDISQ